MDRRISEFLVERFRQENGVDVSNDFKIMARLQEAAEIAKIELTTSTTTRINLPYLTVVDGVPRHMELEFTRAELERLVQPIIERCRQPVEQALKDAGVTSSEIDRVIFVGGPTRMPAVRTFFEGLLGRQAEMGVDPMECVASGAAIQAGVLTGQVNEIVLVDVTPLTLGVETLGGIATSLIARNTAIPVKQSELFTTAADMQTAVTVHVFQGERPMAVDNTSLGQFNLEGLPPAPRGVPQIEVTFDIDANGILDVTAVDMATRKSRSIRITGSTRLPAAEKERMIKVAEQYAEQDRKRREEADQLNTADSLCYQAEKTLAEFGDKLATDLRSRIEASMRDTRAALTQRDAALAAKRSAELQSILQEMGKTIYAQAASTAQTQDAAQASPGTHTAPSGTQAKEDDPQGRVVDAEYADVRTSSRR
jgi:molecular chaperone DnaK